MVLICASRYSYNYNYKNTVRYRYGTVLYRTCMHVFPLYPAVANTFEIKPLDSNPRYIFEQIYGMHT